MKTHIPFFVATLCAGILIGWFAHRPAPRAIAGENPQIRSTDLTGRIIITPPTNQLKPSTVLTPYVVANGSENTVLTAPPFDPDENHWRISLADGKILISAVRE